MRDKKLVISAFKQVLPTSKIKSVFPYKDSWLIQFENPNPIEEGFDGFFIINLETKHIGEFSVSSDPSGVSEAYERHLGDS